MKNITIALVFALLLFCGLADAAAPKAKRIRIEDGGSYYTGTEVETALQEIPDGTIAFDDITVTGDLAVGDDLTVDGDIAGNVLRVDSNIVNLSDTTDEYVLAFDTTTNTWRGVVSAAGATAWDNITNPDANDEIDFASYVIELNIENFQIGDGGSNYVDFDGTPTVTFAGNADINLPNDSVDDDDINWGDLTYLTTNGAGINEAFSSGWDGDVGPPEKDDVYDQLHKIDTNDDGDVDNFDATALETAVEAVVDHDDLQNIDTGEHISWEDASAGTIHTDNYVENVVDTLASTLGAGADGNDVDQTSLGKLEFFDDGLYLDADADGVMNITSDGTLELHSADWDISTTGAITNATWDAADTITRESIYTGTTSLEETTSATDSGGYIVGLNDEFAFSSGTDVQTVIDDLDAAIGALDTDADGDVDSFDVSNLAAAEADTLDIVCGRGAYTDVGLHIDEDMGIEGDLTIGEDLTVDGTLYAEGEIVQTVYEKAAVYENLVAADDNVSLGFFAKPVTITGVAVSYVGTGTTTATITLEDGSGNAMTITGTNPTAVAHGTNATFAAVTAGNTLDAGEIVRMDVTNTPDPTTDDYTIVLRYTIQ